MTPVPQWLEFVARFHIGICAMVPGFFAALPANAWPIRKGWKEKMPEIDPGQVDEGMNQAA